MPLTEEIYSSRKDLVWTDETFYFVYICQIAMQPRIIAECDSILKVWTTPDPGKSCQKNKRFLAAVFGFQPALCGVFKKPSNETFSS